MSKHQSSAPLQEEKNVTNEIRAKTFAATQKVLKNKFKKAVANRLAQENNLNQAMQPLVTDPLSDAKQTRPASTTKVVDNNKKREAKTSIDHIDPNKLCDRLKILLSSLVAEDAEHTQEIKTIINQLRELEILV